MASRTIQIVIKAHNEASDQIEKAEKSVGKFGSGLGSMLAVAGGNLVSSAISSMTGFFSSIAGGAIEAVGKAQNLEIAIEGLLTQSLMYEKVSETQQAYIELTDKEKQKLVELNAKLDTQNARLKEQEQRVWEMTNLWTDEGLATQTAKARLEEMRLEVQATETQISELAGKQGQLITSTTSSWQKTMEFAEAQQLAKEQTQDLLKYVQKLSIISPFETATVEEVVRIGLASGLSAEQVQSFTGAWLDFAATQGISSENLAFATDQLLQLKKAGKLTEIDLRQLRRMGIDLAKIIEIEMGMSVEEFNQKVAQNPALMDDMYAAFIKFSSETTAGASERMAGTIDGLMSSLHDIVELGSRNLFRPIIEAISPFASDLIEELAGYVTGDDITNIGQSLADSFMIGFNFILDGINTVNQLITDIQTTLDGGWSPIEATLMGWGNKFWDWITVTVIPQSSQKIAELAGNLSQNLQKEWMTIYPSLQQWANDFWNWTKEIIPNADANLGEIINSIKTYLTSEWASKIAPNLLEWGSKFWNWTKETITAHPEYLGGITGITAKYLYDNWDTIAPELTRWGNLFWNFITETIIPLAPTELAPIITAIKDNLITKWDEVIKPALETWGNKAFEWVSSAYANIPTFLTTLTRGTADFLTNEWPTIQTALADWGSQFWDWSDTAIATIGTGLQGLAIALAAWATSEEAQQALHDLGSSIGDTLVTTLTGQFENTDNATSILSTLAKTLVTMVGAIAGTLIIVGGEIVAGIIDGILEHIGIDIKPATVTELGTILTQIGQDAKTIASVVGKDIINGVISGIVEIKDNISKEFDEIIESAKNKFLNAEWKEIGNEIVAGLIKGIRQKMGDWTKSITDLASSGIDAAKSFFGVQSPSTVFAEIGGNIMSGLSKGIASNRPAFLDTLTDVLNIRELLRNAGIKGGGTYIHDKVIRNQFLPLLAQMAEKGTLNLESMKKAAQDVAKSLNYPPSYLDSIINWQQWLNVINGEYDELQKKLRLENLAATLGVAGQFAGFGQSASSFLDSQIKTLQELLELGDDEISFQGQILSAAEAQDLLNKKLEEQAEIQKDLIQLQSQQAQLQFMQQQLDIIKMVKEQGLNAADIFQGIKFGLDANVQDLLAVTSNVVQALIEQINSDLQIASPSQVMYKIGQQVVNGLAGGIMANMESVTSAMKSISPANSDNTTSVVNNYFNQTVNTGAKSSTVVQDFQTMAALIG